MKKFQVGFIITIVFTLLCVDLIAADKLFDPYQKKNLSQISDIDFIKDYFNKDLSGNINDYVEDQIYLKKPIREFKALLNRYLLKRPENNSIYIYQDHLFEKVFPRSDFSIENYKRTLRLIAKYTDIDSNFVIPDKSLYLDKYLHLSESDFEDLNLLYDIFSKDDYYKSDLHLTHQGAYKLYQHLVGDALELEFEEVSDAFKGYYYNKSMYPFISDSIFKISDDLTSNLKLCKLDQCFDSVYDFEALNTHDKYNFFNGGLSPVTTIENDTQEGELVIFGDSYSQSFSIMMALNYKKVTIIDLRLMDISQVSNYISENAKVITVYGLKTINDGAISS